jgi:hypothetical protein
MCTDFSARMFRIGSILWNRGSLTVSILLILANSAVDLISDDQ